MRPLPREEFEQLIRDARILESDRRGPKVYETPDGRIVKLFRIKRRLSSNLWSPFAERFAKNAARLNQLGLPSVEVSRVAWVGHLKRQMVIYRKLEGRPLRHVARSEPADTVDACIAATARFVARVHQRGVYFRSFHFGNILVAPDGSFALIDILDVWFKSRPLGAWHRRRNLRHMSRYKEDRATLLHHWDAFSIGYLAEAAALGNARDSARLKQILDAHHADLLANHRGSKPQGSGA